LLWVAISRGILNYLVTHQNDMVKTTQLTDTRPGGLSVSYHVDAIDLNTTGLT
jgi:hypothetical protein